MIEVADQALNLLKNYKMKVLHLTLKKKWFDMIASGEKKEEYREIKMYWATRLQNGFVSTYGIDRSACPDWKEYDYIHFKNGYNRPRTMNVEFKGVEIGYGHEKWGGGYKEVFVIKLGEIIK
jgi:hypothetical protein